MPITLTFDIEQASIHDLNDRTRIIVAFKRLGWEHIGGSTWRYPTLGAQPASEDWFNHVIPALMYFRALVEHSGMQVTQFTIDAHSEAGYRGNPAIGQPIQPGNQVALYPTGLAADYDNKLSEDRLKQFISDAADSL